jgi:hypothetical protein
MKISYQLGSAGGGGHHFRLSDGPKRRATRRDRHDRQMLASTSMLRNLVDFEGVIAFVVIAFQTLALSGGLVFWMLLTITQNNRLSSIQQWALGLEIAIVALVQLAAARFVLVAFNEARSPRPVYAALRQRFRWAIVRLLAGIWWFANGVAMIALGEILLATVTENDAFHDDRGWQYFAVAFVIFLGCSYAANTFFLLTLGAFRWRKRILLKLWQFRIILDAGLALLAVWADHFVTFPKFWR